MVGVNMVDFSAIALAKLCRALGITEPMFMISALALTQLTLLCYPWGQHCCWLTLKMADKSMIEQKPKFNKPLEQHLFLWFSLLERATTQNIIGSPTHY